MPDRITESYVLERLDTIWPAYNAGLARLLSVLRLHFDGDLDAMLILLTISLGAKSEDWRGALLDGEIRAEPQRPTNTQSIAAFTHIPRETVRRKVTRLQRKGWVARTAEGNWHVCGSAASDLYPATIETIGFLRTILAAGLAEPQAGPDRTGCASAPK